jgi:hypothetical protein
LEILLLEEQFDILFERFRGCRGRVTFPDFTIPVNQKFGEIPLDRTAAKNSRPFLFQVNIERMGLVAIHVDLGEHREGHPVGEPAELLDFLLSAGFLVLELVAGKAQDGQPALLVLPV